MILAGDIGGTNVRLALFDLNDKGRLVEIRSARFPSREYAGLNPVLTRFLDTAETVTTSKSGTTVTAAGFGIAGPVVRGRCEATNLPWIVDAKDVARFLGLSRVALLNDLAANGVGLGELSPEDFAVINAGTEDPEGNGALISAGTGLGEAILLREETGRFRPLASEGGHTSFAPRDAHEIKLLVALGERFGHVSYERILSGPGLANLYHFERELSGHPEPPWMTEEITSAGDVAPVLTRAALEGRDDVAVSTVHRFARIYGAEAGNLALKALATGGVFVGGGIAPRLRSVLLDGGFFTAFCDKGRFSTMLARMPIRVVLNDRCALLGAARAGANEVSK